MRTVLARLSAPRQLARGQRKFATGPLPPLRPYAQPLRAPAAGRAQASLVTAVMGAKEGSVLPPDGARVFTSFDVYKGKSALNVKATPATFEQCGDSAYSVKKSGGLLFEMAPSSGQRQYDWSKKIMFMASVYELGEILTLQVGVPSSKVEFIHDPNMGAANAGQVTKTLKMSGMSDGKGLFVNMALRDKAAGQDETLSMPITWGEFAVMRTLIEFSIPRLLAFDRAFAEVPPA